MLSRRLALTLSAALVATLPFAPALAQDDAKLPVVASFSILGDVVARVGGDRIELVTLVGPDGDAHVFQPSPADAEAVAAARVLVVNGLGFEGWMDRLVEASATQALVVTASDGLTPLAASEEGHDHGDDHAHDHAHDHGHDHDHGDEHAHDHGEFDPHSWQSVTNVLTYVANIERGLSEADPAGAETYAANAAAYRAELEALDAEIRAAVEALPAERRTVVTSHDSFGYFAAAYGLTFVSPQGLSTEAEASAQDVAGLITQVRDQGIAAVFVENIADRRLLDQIAAETGARIGGTLYSDALSGPEGPAPTYLAMMRHNLAQLTGALGQ
jgi:zinc/manganese transport system substrate-binding protein